MRRQRAQAIAVPDLPLTDRPLRTGTLVQRYKRFLADVVLDDGTPLTVHCANSGSMKGLDGRGIPVLVSDSGDPKRKLRHTLESVQVDDGEGPTWVGVNTARPNAYVKAWAAAGALPDIGAGTPLRSEVRYGENSRIDILAEPKDAPRVWVEVKNTTLAAETRDGSVQARFPDAVTARGQKHLVELTRAVRRGDRAMLVFFVHRGDAMSFAPACDIDPAYADLLSAAVEAGVEAVAFGTSIDVEAGAAGARAVVRCRGRMPASSF